MSDDELENTEYEIPELKRKADLSAKGKQGRYSLTYQGGALAIIGGLVEIAMHEPSIAPYAAMVGGILAIIGRKRARKVITSF